MATFDAVTAQSYTLNLANGRVESAAMRSLVRTLSSHPDRVPALRSLVRDFHQAADSTPQHLYDNVVEHYRGFIRLLVVEEIVSGKVLVLALKSPTEKFVKHAQLAVHLLGALRFAKPRYRDLMDICLEMVRIGGGAERGRYAASVAQLAKDGSSVVEAIPRLRDNMRDFQQAKDAWSVDESNMQLELHDRASFGFWTWNEPAVTGKAEVLAAICETATVTPWCQVASGCDDVSTDAVIDASVLQGLHSDVANVELVPLSSDAFEIGKQKGTLRLNSASTAFEFVAAGAASTRKRVFQVSDTSDANGSGSDDDEFLAKAMRKPGATGLGGAAKAKRKPVLGKSDSEDSESEDDKPLAKTKRKSSAKHSVGSAKAKRNTHAKSKSPVPGKSDSGDSESEDDKPLAKAKRAASPIGASSSHSVGSAKAKRNSHAKSKSPVAAGDSESEDDKPLAKAKRAASPIGASSSGKVRAVSPVSTSPPYQPRAASPLPASSLSKARAVSAVAASSSGKSRAVSPVGASSSGKSRAASPLPTSTSVQAPKPAPPPAPPQALDFDRVSFKDFYSTHDRSPYQGIDYAYQWKGEGRGRLALAEVTVPRNPTLWRDLFDKTSLASIQNGSMFEWPVQLCMDLDQRKSGHCGTILCLSSTLDMASTFLLLKSMAPTMKHVGSAPPVDAQDIHLLYLHFRDSSIMGPSVMASQGFRSEKVMGEYWSGFLALYLPFQRSEVRSVPGTAAGMSAAAMSLIELMCVASTIGVAKLCRTKIFAWKGRNRSNKNSGEFKLVTQSTMAKPKKIHWDKNRQRRFTVKLSDVDASVLRAEIQANPHAVVKVLKELPGKFSDLDILNHTYGTTFLKAEGWLEHGAKYGLLEQKDAGTIAEFCEMLDFGAPPPPAPIAAPAPAAAPAPVPSSAPAPAPAKNPDDEMWEMLEGIKGVYHSTTVERAEAICREGFRVESVQVRSGRNMGDGVYASGNLKKAQDYLGYSATGVTLNMLLHTRMTRQNTYVVKNRGDVVYDWQGKYDFSYAVPGVFSDKDEICIADPKNVEVIGIFPKNGDSTALERAGYRIYSNTVVKVRAGAAGGAGGA